MDADYADDIALLTNTTTQAKSLLHVWSRQKDALAGLGLELNADKTESMCFNKKKETSLH